MAKRSDFAQKLLDDLRLRKERMTPSQRSNQSHHLPTDAHACTKQTFRGFRNTKANENLSSRTGEMLNRRRHRSINTGELSNQIIPYGKGQSSGHMSQALAFAFENGGKLRRGDFSYRDAIMGFLHQIKRGSVELGLSERGINLDRQVASTRHTPNLSLMQIHEISKGAQKINHILRACSDGLNMDTYSLQFAKELLQGAIDLEESLRMLVDMQKSSAPQGQNKSRLILLEEENDDDDNRRMENSEQMQLARPTFSFDKPSRHAQNHHQVHKAVSMQRLITLTSTKEVRNSNRDNKNVKIQVSQMRSTSSSSEISKQKSQMVSNPESGRIPNVIAKLMGLDNLPEKVEMESKHMHQKDSGNTQKVEGYHGMTSKHTAESSTKKTELKKEQIENLIPLAKKNQKVVETVKIPANQYEELMFGSLLQKASFEGVVQNGKPLWRNLDGIKAFKRFDKTTTKIDKHNKSSAQKNLIRESQNDAKMTGRKQDQPNHSNREQKGTVKGRTNDPILNSMLAQLDQVHKTSEVKDLIRVEKEISGSFIPPEKRNTSKDILNNEKKPQNHLGVPKSHLLSKNGSQYEKHHREQQLQQREEYMLMMRPQGGSEMTSKSSSKPPQQLINLHKKHPSINQATLYKKNSGENVAAMKSKGFLCSHNDDHDLVRDEESNNTNEKLKEIINNRKLGQTFSPREREFVRAKGKHGVKTLKDEKHVHKLASKKIKNTRKLKVDMPGKFDQILTGRNGAKLITEQGKEQIPSLQEARDREADKFNVLNRAEKESVSMSRQADAHIICSNELETVAVAEPLNVRLQPHKEAELLPTLYCCGGGELKSPQESVALLPNDLHYQDVKSVAINLQDQAVLLEAGEGFKTGEIAPHITNGSRAYHYAKTNWC
ncbi:uncharacterized protein LOC130711662 isoform X2 [Lotus japonicus]|uniref:uncharacterized protein LOC130711662 isoform X2 n=1 Tax=Lotus japonicus TaxID=34305 RepID=UPI002584DBF9|nr:uncharacterized protein LOC130711662 isoform X2 [Lotus japonicus]